MVPGSQSVLPSCGWRRPANSCTRKRATRVPVSTVVRMNSASNMMAKWYQSAINPRPNTPLKIWAMPTASEVAPPVRPSRVVSCTDAASPVICAGVTVKPHPRMASAARSTVPPNVPIGALTEK